jgi:glycosyltransferase involved in cell wall biosynthesis
MKKKKILIITSWFPTADSPVGGIFIEQQAEALSRAYEVAVLAPRLVGWGEILQHGLGAKTPVESRREIEVFRERVLSLVPRAPALAYHRWLRAARRLFEKLAAEWGKPDLIHAHVVLPAGWAAVQIGKAYSIPVVLTEHSSPFAIHLRTSSQRRLVNETLAHVDAVVAVSPALAKQVREFYPAAKIRVIGDLIKTSFFIPSRAKRERNAKTHFLSVGLLTKQKGMTYLLRAAQILVERGITAFDLTIGGDGPERRGLEKLSQSLGIAERCKFLGLLSPAEVRDRLQQSDVIVMPSLHETFCIVLAEAMSCGKPVIATRCGGPEYVVTPETGVLVETANAEALADAMSGFISNQKKYEPKIVRQSVVERFGEEAFLRNTTEVYERVWNA